MVAIKNRFNGTRIRPRKKYVLKDSMIYIGLKELEHKRLGWKVLILKYDLGQSLSKEMWCKMTDTKTFLDYIFKKMKNACNMR